MKKTLLKYLVLLVGYSYACSLLAKENNLISFFFQNTPIALVLYAITEHANLNLILDDKIDQLITIKLENIHWQEAIEIISRLHNIQIELKRNILIIQPKSTNLVNDDISQEEMLTQTFFLENISIEKALVLLKSYISDKGEINSLKGQNILVINDKKTKLAAISKLLHDIDIPVPQIQITAHIVSMNRESLKEFGIDWQWEKIDNSLSGSKLSRLRPGSKLSSALTKVGFNLMHLDTGLLLLELEALESENQLEIIASPRLFTSNQQAALIKQGTEIPYEIVSGNSGATAIEFKEAVLGMEVTPDIKSKGAISLMIKITQNMPGQIIKRQQGEVLAIDKQEIQTTVTINNNETLIIGGISQQLQQKSVRRVPLLGHLPVLDKLLQSNHVQYQNRELIIFITPKLLNDTPRK